MFGYATDETEECMPLTVVLAHALNRKLAELRRNNTLWWARPDTKTQVTCEYKFENGACVPIRVHTIVVSTQHSEKVNQNNLHCKLLAVCLFDRLISYIGQLGSSPRGGHREGYKGDNSCQVP